MKKLIDYTETSIPRGTIFKCKGVYPYEEVVYFGVMDKNEAVKLCNPLFYLPLQAFENMNKKSAFTVVVK